MAAFDVVIIGAGIVGSSIAWNLTRQNVRKILLLERESSLGKGSTGKSMGGVRAQFATAPNIRMSLYSIPFFARFEETVGHPSGYKPQGYLFAATTQAHLDYLARNHALQRSLGLEDTCLLSGAEVRGMAPRMRGEDILGGSFCSTDGFVDPHSVMTGFAAGARDAGAVLWRDAEVTAIDAGNNSFTVHTKQGSASAPVVVNAAGPWAADVARLVNVDLPVRPLRRMLVPTEPFDELPQSLPMIVDMSTGFHFRPEGRGFLMAWNDRDEPSSQNTNFDPAFLEKILLRAADRVPAFEHVAVNPKRCWAGLYEMSPDHHCIFGAAPGLPGFYCANGFSGHGVMHSPATGRILADLITAGRTELLDWRELGLARFAEGREIHETAVL